MATDKTSTRREFDNSPEATQRRYDQNAQYFLDMEDEVHDISRHAFIAYDYVHAMFRKGKSSIIEDCELTIDEMENILFLLGETIHRSKSLASWYSKGEA